MTIHRGLKVFIHCVGATLLLACQGYEVTLNDREIYRPPSALTEFQLADRNLQNCVDQTIKDQKVTAVAQLTQLSCTHGGIADLSGLEFFLALEALNLSDNAITQIEPLAKLGKLKTLHLANNQLKSTDAVLSLLQLQELDLRGNKNLACGELARLAVQSPAKLNLPEHCL